MAQSITLHVYFRWWVRPILRTSAYLVARAVRFANAAVALVVEHGWTVR